MRTRFIALAAALALLVSALATGAATASTSHHPTWRHHHRMKCVKRFVPEKRLLIKRCVFKRHGHRTVLIVVIKLPPKQEPVPQPVPQPGH